MAFALRVWLLMCLSRLILRRSDAGDGAPDEGITFGDALRHARREDFHLDTYAMRALVFQTPQSVEVRIWAHSLLQWHVL